MRLSAPNRWARQQSKHPQTQCRAEECEWEHPPECLTETAKEAQAVRAFFAAGYAKHLPSREVSSSRGTIPLLHGPQGTIHFALIQMPISFLTEYASRHKAYTSKKPQLFRPQGPEPAPNHNATP